MGELGSSGKWFGESGNASQLVVKATCNTCGDCVELEHTFTLCHDHILQFELPDDMGCPLDHEYKCSHMGHKGKCKMICMECGEWWDDDGDQGEENGLSCRCMRSSSGMCAHEQSTEGDSDGECSEVDDPDPIMAIVNAY